MIRVCGAGKTDVGKVRKRNEDAFFADETAGTFLVADGLGGHASGEVASRITTETIGRRLGGSAISSAGVSVAEIFRQAIREADAAIAEEIYRDPGKRNMASTLVGCVVRDGLATFAHVGDSRAYMIRDGRISQIDRDHSWVAEQVSIGILTPEEARTHPFRNIVTKALGNGVGCDPNVDEVVIQPGDRFILCSDGLSGPVRDEDILDAARNSHNPQHCVSELVRLALENGGDDNITAIAIYCDED